MKAVQTTRCDSEQHRALHALHAEGHFCDNLRAYLEGGPLWNVIDWERGY